MKRVYCFLMTLLIMSGMMTACAKNEPPVEATKPKAETVAIEKTKEQLLEEKRQAKEKQLQGELDQVMGSLAKNGTDYSVYVYVPELDASYEYNNKRMGSASMIKVYILEMAYNEIAQGRLTEDAVLKIESDTRVGGAGSLQGYGIGTPIKMSTLLNKMIIESDNTATNMLIKYFGMDNINAYMQKKGYTESLLCRRMMDYKSLQAGRDNVTSVRDLGRFFKRVYAGAAVNDALDKRMISILKQQEDTNKIPFYLPQGLEVAHKTGEINAVMNDGGIVYAKHPFVLCVLTDKAPGYNLAITQVAKLSKSIYDVIEKESLYADTETADSAKAVSAAAIPSIELIDKPVTLTEYKKQLMKEYSLKHYGTAMTTIEPQAVVVHWTAAPTMSSAYNWFYGEEYGNAPGTLNVGSQFIVDRDGKIYRLMPETTLARHSIGYNWCAIGIENVGGENHKENLTEQQLEANIKLITYLKAKFPNIKYVWGHYQQDKAKKSGLYKENVSGYYSGKDDPGPTFMKNLRIALSSKGLIFFEE